MLCKECLGEVHKVWNRPIVSIRPKAGEFKAMAGLFAPARPILRYLFKMLLPSGVGVVLGMGAVGDDEYLDIIVES